MMDHDAELKLQAWLDGELPAAEAAAVEAALARDAEGARLLAELKNTKTALAGHEAEVKLPESRDFFWSKVRREIERVEQRPAATTPGVAWLGLVRVWLMPLGGAAALAILLGVLLTRPTVAPASDAGEMELASDDMGAYTFRDQEQKMTFVWFYDRTPGSSVAQPVTVAGIFE